MKYFIVVDMQNDFCTGTLANPDAVRIIPHIREAVVDFLEEDLKDDRLVIFTRDTHGSDYLETLEGKNLPVTHCIRETKGWEVVDELKEIINDPKYKDRCKYIDKNRFGYDHWDRQLEPFSEVTMVGVCTDICVISNALGIKALPDMDVTILAGCCAGLTPEKHKAAIETLRSCQCKIVLPHNYIDLDNEEPRDIICIRSDNNVWKGGGDPNHLLTVGKVYKLESMYVDDDFTLIKVEGIDKEFNSVLFSEL